MSWLFGDTFDGYAVTNFTRKWTNGDATNNSSSSISFTSAAGRHGSNGFRVSSATSSVNRLASVTLITSGATCIAGFSLTVSNLTVNQIGTTETISSFARIRDNGTTQIWFRLNTSGTISAFRSTTLLGTTTGSLSAGVTSHVGFKVVIDPSSGSVVVYINGTPETIFSGNTRGSSGNTWNQIEIGGMAGSSPFANFDYDDFYVLDGSGSLNNDFLGDLRGDALYATADGANTDFTPNSGSNHYDRINETTPDDDTTYNSTITVGAKDTFVTQDAPVAGANIYAVQLNILSKKTDAGSAAVKGVARIGGTDYLTAEKSISSAYSYPRGIVFEQDPSGPTPWTDTVFNAAEFGYQKSS